MSGTVMTVFVRFLHLILLIVPHLGLNKKKEARCSVYRQEAKNSAQVQARGCITVSVGYELCSSLKTLL